MGSHSAGRHARHTTAARNGDEGREAVTRRPIVTAAWPQATPPDAAVVLDPRRRAVHPAWPGRSGQAAPSRPSVLISPVPTGPEGQVSGRPPARPTVPPPGERDTITGPLSVSTTARRDQEAASTGLRWRADHGHALSPGSSAGPGGAGHSGGSGRSAAGSILVTGPDDAPRSSAVGASSATASTFWADPYPSTGGHAVAAAGRLDAAEVGGGHSAPHAYDVGGHRDAGSHNEPTGVGGAPTGLDGDPDGLYRDAVGWYGGAELHGGAGRHGGAGAHGSTGRYDGPGHRDDADEVWSAPPPDQGWTDQGWPEQSRSGPGTEPASDGMWGTSDLSGAAWAAGATASEGHGSARYGSRWGSLGHRGYDAARRDGQEVAGQWWAQGNSRTNEAAAMDEAADWAVDTDLAAESGLAEQSNWADRYGTAWQSTSSRRAGDYGGGTFTASRMPVVPTTRTEAVLAPRSEDTQVIRLPGAHRAPARRGSRGNGRVRLAAAGTVSIAGLSAIVAGVTLGGEQPGSATVPSSGDASRIQYNGRTDALALGSTQNQASRGSTRGTPPRAEPAPHPSQAGQGGSSSSLGTGHSAVTTATLGPSTAPVPIITLVPQGSATGPTDLRGLTPSTSASTSPTAPDTSATLSTSPSSTGLGGLPFDPEAPSTSATPLATTTSSPSASAYADESDLLSTASSMPISITPLLPSASAASAH
ncbi:conserved hypothetical protein [Frankia sp. AiPs1]|uniref:hypothetical protein n=1 Tax=Frankia sp. AiPa1 TaxID=573492 RepID=UPI00202B5478|nr:hypothetical protein [Frankia sp. AiPa1]MCL9757849.1 hypothetical protein [Frankia sp. AiPa1]